MANIITTDNYLQNQQNFDSQTVKTLTRLREEFQLCSRDDDLIQIGCNFGLFSDHNIYNWKVTMVGPFNTPYKSGVFIIKISFTNDYPNHGPLFRFMNKIYHLNVNPEDGMISLNYLNEWHLTGKVTGKSVYTIKQALFDIFYLFYKQNPNNAFNKDMAYQYIHERKKFDEEAKRWNEMYTKVE